MAASGGVRILGIDPGTLVVGYACLELSMAASRVVAEGQPRRLAMAAANAVSSVPGRRRVQVVDSGVLNLGGKALPIEQRLSMLWHEVSELLQRLSIDEVAIEEAFYKKNVGSALRMGEARGVILAAVGANRIGLRQFAPARIKRSVTGNGRATKDAVARMVCQQLGLPAIPGPRDITDALAIACCWVEDRAGFLIGSPCNSAAPDF